MARRLRLLVVTAGLAAATIGAAGCGVPRAGGSVRSGPATITVTETDASIRLSPSSPVASGTYSLVVRNDGTMSHELVVFRVARPSGPVPTFRSGDVDESSRALEQVADTGAMPPGASRTVDAPLRPGSYVLLCNVSGHYQAGMRATLTVRPA